MLSNAYPAIMQGLQEKYLSEITAANDLTQLESLRVAALGKRGELTALMQGLKDVPPEERRERGQALNGVKTAIAEAIAARQSILEAAALRAQLDAEREDITLPVRPQPQGRIHPITQVTEEALTILADMGFSLAEGPDLEDDFHNFTALNFPPEHPARQMHDTFFITPETPGEDPKVLRTHTSPVQIRTMLGQKPPLKIVVPGRTYRSDYDQTHTPMFHQLEGLVVNKTATMAELKGVLQAFCRALFGVPSLEIRFRPSFFPFTEPSAEVDIGCDRSGGKLEIGTGSDWLEILGCGMVHPNVLRNCGLDPDEYQGYAFGMGLDRLAMLKYGIPDLRTFFESDGRWLDHYGFDPLDRPNRALNSHWNE